MATREIRCESCGTLNRLPNYSVRRIPECGKCHSSLPEARSIVLQRMIYRFRIRVAAIALVGTLALVLAGFLFERGKQVLAKAPRTDIPQSIIACGQYLLPSQLHSDEYERPTVLTVKTAPGLFYLVKLEKSAADFPPLLFFIEGGQSFEAKVPLGEFRLKYAVGTHWCADADLFSADTIFSEADSPLTFGASPMIIELPLQGNGIPVMRQISRNEFYGRDGTIATDH